MDGIREAELPHHMVKADLFVQLPVFGKEDRAADKVAHQGQHAAADKGLAADRIAGQIDVGETVQTAISQLRPLGGDIQQSKEGRKMERIRPTRGITAAALGASTRMARAIASVKREFTDTVFKS